MQLPVKLISTVRVLFVIALSGAGGCGVELHIPGEPTGDPVYPQPRPESAADPQPEAATDPEPLPDPDPDALPQPPRETGNRTYVGALDDGDTLIGIVVDDERALAYICDGRADMDTISGWFEGSVYGDGTLRMSAAGGDYSAYADAPMSDGEPRTLAATFVAGGVNGVLTESWGGVSWSAELADPATAAGVYYRADEVGLTSVVIDNDHRARGLARIGDIIGGLVPIGDLQVGSTQPFEINLPTLPRVDVGRIFTPIVVPDTVPLLPASAGNVLEVKFAEGLDIGLIGGEPRDRQGSALRSAAAVDAMMTIRRMLGKWSRGVELGESRVDEMRRQAEAYWGELLPDLNLYFTLRFPHDVDILALRDTFAGLADVEHAYLVPQLAVPVPEDYSTGTFLDMSVVGGKVHDHQGYLDPAVGPAGEPWSGIDARYAWTFEGGRGEHVAVCDIEYGWNFDHEDLPPINLIDPDDEFTDDLQKVNHGTNTLGVIFGRDNGWGVTGIVPEAEPWVHSRAGDGAELKNKLMNAADRLDYGDVILIELAMDVDPPLGPAGIGPDLAVEAYKPVFDAIRYTVGNGRVVIEPAGNGAIDLDTPNLADGLNVVDGFRPFAVAASGNRLDDSGAIIVGAGSSPVVAASQLDAFPGSAVPPGSLPRQALGYSCFGARVDLQGWGQDIVTTGGFVAGPGDLYEIEGENLWFTNDYRGTSGASPIVTGAAAALQSIWIAESGYAMSPADLRDLLIQTGSAQTGDLTTPIGPLPDLRAAIDRLLALEPQIPVVSSQPYCTAQLAMPRPRFSIASAAVSTPLDVEILFGDVFIENSVIYFTLDGTEPASCADAAGCGSTQMWTQADTLAGRTLTITPQMVPLTVRAKQTTAGCGGTFLPTSQTAVAIYLGAIPAPQVTVAGGTYPGGLSVQLTTGLPVDAYIRYTLDGTDPDDDGNVYDGTASPVWTNTRTANMEQIPIFTIHDEGASVTLKAQNFVYSGDSTVGYIGGDILEEHYVQGMP